MNVYFPKQKPLGGNMRVELDLSNYATKTDFKKETSYDTSDFAKKADLASLKTVPIDLSKLSYVVINDVVKENVYYKQVTKVNGFH